MTLVMTYMLDPTESGTRLRVTVRPQTRVPHFAAKRICNVAMKSFGIQGKLNTLADLCAGECVAPTAAVSLPSPSTA